MTLELASSELVNRRGYIGGEWTTARSGKEMDVRNPATGELLTRVADMSGEDAASAIAAAAHAFSSWKFSLASERAAVLKNWNRLLLENEEVVARLMTLEQGKPLAESRSEVRYAAAFMEWYSEEAKRLNGEILPTYDTTKRLLVVRQPVGVVGTITPWNFPAAMITRKVAPAIAAGCTVVSKPAPQTPLTALALAYLGEKAGLPAGVFNVVPGLDAIGIADAFTNDEHVAKISFTGSTAVGKKLMAACARTIKRISLELGGNAPFIVFDDANLEAAVLGAIQSKFRNTGQTCVCANRFLVHRKVAKAFVSRFVEAVSKLPVGNGLVAGIAQGPMISEEAVRKVEEHISDACRKGASVLCGGQRHSLGGFFFQPTVLSDVNPSMRVASEETFGPVAPILIFESDEQAIEIANDTRAGLAAYFYTQSIERYWRVSERLEYGIVGHNTGLISTEIAPFGGMKESGLGREGSHHGILDYTELKYICSSVN